MLDVRQLWCRRGGWGCVALVEEETCASQLMIIAPSGIQEADLYIPKIY